MKNPLKKIVPILLTIAVLGCAFWFFTVYDRDLTRDLMIQQARYFDSEGRHDLAAWFYDQAYIFADNDDAVAIELAEQYKSSGNYTKAEYTLTKAISDGGGSALYIALSQTYVDQDKLMDAVSMLDNISDPSIKAELDALRPAVPSVSLTPSYYTQYMTVDISVQNGTLLVSTDREYPSVNEDAYSGPIQLPQGESIIYALAIGDNGLVSPLGIYGYTIGGVIEPVIFTDAAIEAEIRSILGVDTETVIYTDDLWTITEFTIPADAQDYSNISDMKQLLVLNITKGIPEELNCLSSLTNLQELFITGCTVDKQTLSTVALLPELTTLTLAQCGLSDISPLSNASGLEYLDLSYNSIGDISSLSFLTGLKTLYLSHNALTDLSALSGLTNLENLNVSYNSLTSISPICGNAGLGDLNVSHNLLISLGAVDKLTVLTELDASYNKLTDVSVLGSCTGLVELNISNNEITDISALAPLEYMQKFDFSYNSVAALPEWSKTMELIIIDGSFNQITDLKPLQQMEWLNKVYMDYNPELSSVQELAYCPNLIEVNVFGTKVVDVEILTSQSIIVHYNPTEIDVQIDTETTPEEETEPTE